MKRPIHPSTGLPQLFFYIACRQLKPSLSVGQPGTVFLHFSRLQQYIIIYSSPTFCWLSSCWEGLEGWGSTSEELISIPGSEMQVSTSSYVWWAKSIDNIPTKKVTCLEKTITTQLVVTVFSKHACFFLRIFFENCENTERQAWVHGPLELWWGAEMDLFVIFQAFQQLIMKLICLHSVWEMFRFKYIEIFTPEILN